MKLLSNLLQLVGVWCAIAAGYICGATAIEDTAMRYFIVCLLSFVGTFMATRDWSRDR